MVARREPSRPGRTALALLLLCASNALFLACQSPQTPPSLAAAPEAAPTKQPATALPAASLTGEPRATPAPPQSPVWIQDSGPLMIGVDAQNGKVLRRIRQPYGNGPTATSPDGRWRYWLGVPSKAKGWKMPITQVDLQRGGDPRQFLLTGLADVSDRAHDDLQRTDLLVSPDNRYLIVTHASNTGTQWVTRVQVLDTGSGEAAEPIVLWTGDAQSRPEALDSVASPDGRYLYVVTKQAQGGDLRTQIAMVNLLTRRVESTVDAPAEGMWLDLMLTKDGGMLYALELLVRDAHPAGHRFTAFDTHKRAVVVTQQVEQAHGGEGLCEPYNARFTPDERYLYDYCYRTDRRAHGYFQFLDTRTGLVVDKVELSSAVKNPGMGDGIAFAMIAAPDNRSVYIANTQTHEVAALDLERRAISGSALLQEPRPDAASPLRMLEGLFVSSASAKMRASPAAAISRDGERLYFVDVVDWDKGNGVWAVDTRTLKPLGHWLAGKQIIGLQLNAGDRELLALSPNNGALFALDAVNGRTLRTFEHLLGGPAGFAVTPLGMRRP
jgi:DNA-binding beta-propeller fold protein YncE